MRHLAPLLTILLYSWMPQFSTAQTNLLNYVPPEASVVVGFHFDRMDKKVNLRELRQVEFMDMLETELAQMANEQDVLMQVLSNPYQAGIDLNKEAYFFAVFNDDRSTNTGLLFHVEDFPALTAFMEPLGPSERQSLFSYLHTEPGSAVAWSRQVMLFIWGTSPPPAYSPWEYDWEDGADGNWNDDWGTWEDYEDGDIAVEAPIEEIEEEATLLEDEFPATDVYEFDYDDTWADYERERDSLLFEAMDIWTRNLLANAGLRSISTNTHYQRTLNSGDDISMWVDYGKLMNNPSFLREFGLAGSSGYLVVSQGLIELFDDAYLSMGVSFEKGEAVLRTDMYMQPELLQFYRNVNEAKFNKRLARYVKDEDLLGYAFFNFNSRNFWEGLQELILPEIEKTPFVGELVRPGLDVLGILIDQDAIYNLFKGDALVAFHGLQAYEAEEYFYDYDEDFNFSERVERVTKYYPEFVYLMSYGNEDDVRKLLRLGEAATVLRKDGNYVYRVEAGNFIPFDLFFRLDKGVLILSNNEKLAHTRRGKGFKCKERLSKKHRRLMAENAVVSHWDIPAITRTFSATETGQVINLGPSKFGNLVVTYPKAVGSSVNSRVVLQMQNNEQNALETLFGMINNLMLEQMGGYGS
jgi:hypothetical protein